MTVSEMTGTSLYVPVETIALLLLTLHMSMIFVCLKYGRSLKLTAIYTVHFLISFICVFWPIKIYIWLRTFSYVNNLLPGPVVEYGNVPAYLIIIYEAVTAVILAAAFCEFRYFRKNTLTNDSIKETMDLLPAGIAFVRSDNTVIFSNNTMNELSRRLTGKGITDLSAFREAVTGDSINAGMENKNVANWPETDVDEKETIINQAEAETDEKEFTGSIQISLPDGSGVWQLVSEPLSISGESFIQLTDTEITEQAAIAKELEEQNKKLRDINMRLSIYNKQAEQIVAAQELLSARMAVHNEVGNVLLECRHYLQGSASMDEAQLLESLKNTNNGLLKEFEEENSVRDSLADALQMADAIGVDVTISGIIPADEPYRTILAAAISECAANTVKHAGGDQLDVDIRGTGGEMIFILRSNGIKPAAEIRESGGLLSLRTLVEKENGTMRTAIDPCFQLMIYLTEEQ